MSDFMTLLGAEDVRSAANTMSHAAERISSAISQLDYFVTRLERALQEHAERIERATQNGEGR
jgi:prefoldin subunit 5